MPAAIHLRLGLCRSLPLPPEGVRKDDVSFGKGCGGCSVLNFHLRPYRDEHSASRPIRADKHRRGQRVLTWVTSREHCAAAGFFLLLVALSFCTALL